MEQYYIFSQVTSTNRAGVVWVAAILSLLFSTLTLATRLTIKHHSLWYDDWAIFAATVVALGQYIAVFVGLSDGIGISTTLLTEDAATALGRNVMASEILLVVALMLSKLSIALFMKRLFTRDLHRAWWACNLAVVLTLMWGLGSVLAMGAECGPSHALYGAHRCAGKLTRWGFVVGTDAALEVFYFTLAIILMYPLHMTTYIKLAVILAFAFRLVCSIFSAVHGVFIGQYVHSSDPGLAIANVLLWQQVLLGYSLMAATIPTLKSFVRGYNKAMGWDASSEKRHFGEGYNLGSHQRSGMNASNHSRGLSRRSGPFLHENDSDGIELRPKDCDYHAGAYHVPGSSEFKTGEARADSRERESPIIRRDFSVMVERE